MVGISAIFEIMKQKAFDVMDDVPVVIVFFSRWPPLLDVWQCSFYFSSPLLLGDDDHCVMSSFSCLMQSSLMTR